jgi:hypothetical protein
MALPGGTSGLYSEATLLCRFLITGAVSHGIVVVV